MKERIEDWGMIVDYTRIPPFLQCLFHKRYSNIKLEAVGAREGLCDKQAMGVRTSLDLFYGD